MASCHEAATLYFMVVMYYFSWGTELPNLRFAKLKIKKKCILAEIAKFNAHQIFSLYGMYHSLLVISPLPPPPPNYYCIVGKVGEVFNLVFWRSRKNH